MYRIYISNFLWDGENVGMGQSFTKIPVLSFLHFENNKTTFYRFILIGTFNHKITFETNLSPYRFYCIVPVYRFFMFGKEKHKTEPFLPGYDYPL
ncbi:hypothetical protein Cfast33896_13550 [Coprobacter fastidiosus]|nr:hypothetical protein Cfast33896_13550 [Coprobacter fastidiosus]